MRNENVSFTKNPDLRFQDALQTEEIQGLKIFIYSRTAGLFIIGVWAYFSIPYLPLRFYVLGILLVFAALGFLQFFLSVKNPKARWIPYLFVALDLSLLTCVILIQSPLARFHLPPQMMLRENFIFFFLFLSGVSLSYSPSLVLWTGICSALAWGIGTIWNLGFPETTIFLSDDITSIQTADQFASILLQPTFVNIITWIKRTILILLVSGILAASVWRLKRFIRKYAISEIQRANLARYFSPKLLDEITVRNRPFEVQKHDVAILFADIMGFTKITESIPPEATMHLLRQYHARTEELIFRYGGTLDKFVGDAVMASFGVPHPGPKDATNSLNCARSLLQSIEDWNRLRIDEGEPPIKIGIGLHYGPAVMGDVGSERCAAFAVVGDTTNLASRLQSLTRTIKAKIVVSQQFAKKVEKESSQSPRNLEGFVYLGPQSIRGRESDVDIWAFQ
jgi:adenylate cyclase